MKHGSSIAVFDSGIGGLSVLSELQKLLPHFEYHYCLDNAFFPYGTKSDEVLLTRLTQLLPTLVKHCKADILVVACNTASTIALEEVRKHVHIPVVGVVPAIKPAALHSHTHVIGLLATEATVRRPYTDTLIQQFAHDCEVVKVGSRKLVDLAESKIRGNTPSLTEIQNELAPFFQNEKLDTIVLACTHFDHLREDLEKASPRPIRWLSSANAIAQRTKKISEDIQMPTTAKARNTLICTQDAPFSPEVLKTLFRHYHFHSLEKVSL